MGHKPKKLKSRLSIRQAIVILIFAVVAGIGSYFLVTSHALSQYVSSEAESGNPISPAVKVTAGPNSATASNNSFVQFGSSTNGTGNFQIKGTQIIDPNGNNFTPIGGNVNGQDFVWADPTVGNSSVAQEWGFNIIRFDSCYVGGCPTSATGAGQVYDYLPNTLAPAVAEYTAKKIVVLLDLQEFTGNGLLTPAQNTTLQNWWVSLAKTYKNNPYVWFNILNEPTGDNNLSDWSSDYVPTVKAIRALGINNIIVMDGSAYGQDIYDWTCTGLPYANSAIINEIPALESTYGNILPSVHVYSDWGGGSTTPACTQTQLDTRFTTYIQKVHSVGLPLVIGETGDQPNPSGDPWWAAGQYAAVQTAFDDAHKQGIGLLWWHTSDSSGYWLTTASGGSGWDTINSPTNPTNLTSYGKLLWGYGHGVYP